MTTPALLRAIERAPSQRDDERHAHADAAVSRASKRGSMASRASRVEQRAAEAQVARDIVRGWPLANDEPNRTTTVIIAARA